MDSEVGFLVGDPGDENEAYPQDTQHVATDIDHKEWATQELYEAIADFLKFGTKTELHRIVDES